MENKVIQFPTKRSYMRKLQKETQKYIITGSLVSVFAVTLFLNNQLSRIQVANQEGGRGIASVEDGVSQSQTQWEHDLARDLARSPKRKLASVGQTNHEGIDQLAFIELAGRYSLTLNKGRVTEVRFSGLDEGQSKVQKTDWIAFLKSHPNVWKYDFKHVNPIEESKNKKIFELVSDSKQVLGRVTIDLDESSGLVGLHFDE